MLFALPSLIGGKAEKVASRLLKAFDGEIASGYCSTHGGLLRPRHNG